MPQVPYTPYPTERPNDRGTPELRVSTPGAAFGTTIGSALEGLGSSISHAGDELFKRAIALQELQNETAAKEADARYMIGAGELHAKFSALKGTNAGPDALKKYMADLQGLRQQTRAELPNDMARKMYDSSSLSTMGQSIFNGAGHSARQMKVAAKGAASARIDAMNVSIQNNPTDEVNAKRIYAGQEAEVRQYGDLEGWSKEKTDSEVYKQRSKALSHRITGMAKTEPFKANDMLQENEGNLHPVDKERVENTVTSAMRTVGARSISDVVNADLYSTESATRPEKSLQARIADGMDRAEKTRPNDPLFKDFVRDRITADFNRHKSAVRDFEFDNRNTIAGALNGSVDGKLPINVDELKALNPKVSAAWDGLTDIQKTHYLKQMAQNAKGEMQWTTEGLKRYQELKGMAHDDPNEFLAIDPTAEKMPNRAKLEMINLQQKLKANAEGDPRVNRALGVLKPALDAAGIDRTKDKTGYYEFVGSLQDALNVYQEEHKKSPNFKEVQEIGSRLMQEQITSKFLWLNFKTPLYQLTVPSDVAEKIKSDPSWKEHGIEPSDEQIRRVYIRKRYQELYGQGAAKELAK